MKTQLNWTAARLMEGLKSGKRVIRRFGADSRGESVGIQNGSLCRNKSILQLERSTADHKFINEPSIDFISNNYLQVLHVSVQADKPIHYYTENLLKLYQGTSKNWHLPGHARKTRPRRQSKTTMDLHNSYSPIICTLRR